MEKIVPRWEWRSFGAHFGDAELRMRALAPVRVRESAEVYILSAASNDNTKIRDMSMDIKTLQEINEDGLEQWKPLMKGSFPLPAHEILKVFGVLRVHLQPLHREAYTVGQFIDELVNVSPHLRAVDVLKKRTGYSINGCIAELADVTIGEFSTRTVAIEAEDPVRVITTVRQIGLDRFPQINYLRSLKSLVHMTL